MMLALQESPARIIELQLFNASLSAKSIECLAELLPNTAITHLSIEYARIPRPAPGSRLATRGASFPHICRDPSYNGHADGAMATALTRLFTPTGKLTHLSLRGNHLSSDHAAVLGPVLASDPW
jgi:hypothetical protein